MEVEAILNGTEDDRLVLKPETAEDIKIYTSPWVSGTRAAAYFGPVTHEITQTRPKNMKQREKVMVGSFVLSLSGLRVRVLDLGGNAIVGLELQVDPFVYGDIIHWVATGTAARLELL